MELHVEKKRKNKLRVIKIKDIIGYEDAPEPTPNAIESYAWHQINPVILNYLPDKKKYEVVDGRDRILGRLSKDIADIQAIVYEELTIIEKHTLAIQSYNHKRTNWIYLFQAVKELEEHGVNPTEIQEKHLRLKKSDYARLKLLDRLHERFVDIFTNGDRGFRFSKACAVARLLPEQQEELVELYDEEGKITNDDIRRVKMAKQEQDLGEMFSSEEIENINEINNWKLQIKTLAEQFDIVCPQSSPLRRHLDKFLKEVEKNI